MAATFLEFFGDARDLRVTKRRMEAPRSRTPKRWFQVNLPWPFFAGVLTAQIVAMLFLWDSNQRVIERAWLIEANGYLSIPTYRAAVSLDRMGSLACGGLFFSLTLGVALSVLTVSWQKMHARLPRLRTCVGVSGGGLWIACVWGVNANGFSGWPTLFFVLVPLSVLMTPGRFSPAEAAPPKRLFFLSFAVPLVILSGVLAFTYDDSMFVRFRDAVLLKNPLGEAMNRFYYHHTLTAAEAIKPLHQKSVRTFRWEGPWPSSVRDEIGAILTNNDYVPVTEDAAPDIAVSLDRSKITFKDPGQRAETVGLEAFKNAPGRHMEAFSIRVDRFFFFRRALFGSLLIGVPLFVFAVFYRGLFRAARIFLAKRSAAFTAGVVCLVMGLGLLTVVGFQDPRPLETVEMEKFARSPRTPMRLKAAQALAHSPSKEAEALLLQMMKDPQVNVSCMAIRALGRRGDRANIEPLREFLTGESDWYRQWYAYRALRKLGWRQKAFP